MNKELDTTTFRPGAFISETAVRGALERRTRSLPTHAGGAGRRHPSDTVGDPSSRVSRPRRLRRWSVAELLAGALARSPAGEVVH